MSQPDQSQLFQLTMEQLIEHGPEAFRDVMSTLMNEAMTIRRSTHSLWNKADAASAP